MESQNNSLPCEPLYVKRGDNYIALADTGQSQIFHLVIKHGKICLTSVIDGNSVVVNVKANVLQLIWNIITKKLFK